MSATLSRYVLGQSQHEYNRLALQGQLLRPMTRRVFEDAGIQTGMRVLDLGSGAGDGCLLLAEMVGPSGSVLGVEMDPGAVEFSRARVRTAGFRNVEFVVSGITEYAPPADHPPFDALVGRMVLLYQSDPGAALSSAVRHVRPGGIVALLEPWLMSPPPGAGANLSPVQKAAVCLIETMRRSGASLDLGLRLHKIFLSAGLPLPSMRFEALLDPAEDTPIHKLFADSIVSILPKAVELGVVEPGQIDLAALPGQLRDLSRSTGYASLMLPTACAWSRKPESAS